MMTLARSAQAKVSAWGIGTGSDRRNRRTRTGTERHPPAKVANTSSNADENSKAGLKADSQPARRRGRPRRVTALRKPRIGSWITPDDDDDDKCEDGCASLMADGKPNGDNAQSHVSSRAIGKPQYAMTSWSFTTALEPQTQTRVLQSFTSLSESMYPPNFCTIFPIYDAIWFKYLSQDLLFLSTILFITSAHRDASSPSTCNSTTGLFSPATSRLLADILTPLQRRIDGGDAAADQTIAVVVALAVAADLHGDFEGARKHVGGMARLVGLRGGIRGVGYWQLRMKCCRVDLQVALSTGARPLLFAGHGGDGISWEPYFADSDGIEKQHLQLREFFASSVGGRLDERLDHVWGDARELCANVNLAHLTGRRMEPSLFQEVMLSLQYRLLSLRYTEGFTTEDKDRGVGSGVGGAGRDGNTKVESRLHHEALRHGVLAFTTTIFLHVTNMRVRHSRPASAFKAALLALGLPRDGETWRMRLWLLFIAGLSHFGDSGGCGDGEQGWLKERIRVTLAALRVGSWTEVRNVLKGFLWVDLTHDAMGKRLYDCSLLDV